MRKLRLVLLIFSSLFFILALNPEVCFSDTGKPRYVSIAPSTTEILFALGLDEEIAGVSTYCNYPPEANNKVRVGEFSQINLEKIISLKPDYIFSTGLEQFRIVEELRRQNLKVYVADPSSLRELLNTIEEMGRITGKAKEAQVLIQNMQNQIGQVQAKVKMIPVNRRQKVFIEIWDDPLMTAGKGTFVDDLITLAGGENIAFDTKRAYSIFSQEEVIRRNPDCIILVYMKKSNSISLMEGRFGWNNILAVKSKRIFNDINPDLLLRPGPRVVLGLKEVYKRLYPDEK